ncbi:protein LEG1 homolog [Nannospalax galili]|uniref:protein LEG1 homolog n=1 Tax=Nannospalax galili TaxID=1026970 RepID=UPI0004ED40C4|nr:protein LEG1 homolog [Nannospalax galili]
MALGLLNLILAGCFSAALAQYFDSSALYSPLWGESPGQLNDYRLENGKFTINPQVFTNRMGMYKNLLTQTAKYSEKFAPANEQNFLWGLPLFYGCQYKLGILADPSRRTRCSYRSRNHLCISVDSYWGDKDFYLYVLPLFAAADSGILGISSDQVMLLPPPKHEMSTSYHVSGCQSSFPEIMENWSSFYQYIESTSSKFIDFLKYYWNAQTKSLEYPATVFKDM